MQPKPIADTLNGPSGRVYIRFSRVLKNVLPTGYSLRSPVHGPGVAELQFRWFDYRSALLDGGP
jgi:hypothetical protein